MKIISLILGFFYVSFIQAENIENDTALLLGIGQVKSPPDMVKLDIEVRSECFSKPIMAQRATDKMVKEIYDYLESLKKPHDEQFKVIIRGGFTKGFSRWDNAKEYCKNTFQKSTSIIFKTGNVKDFDQTFAQIQNKALEKFAEDLPVGENERPRTYVYINEPVPDLVRTHRVQLEKDALNLALIDAKKNFISLTKSCRKSIWKIKNIVEENMNNFAPVPMMRSGFAQSAGRFIGHEAKSTKDIDSPINFADLIIEKELKVTFQFKGELCYDE